MHAAADTVHRTLYQWLYVQRGKTPSKIFLQKTAQNLQCKMHKITGKTGNYYTGLPYTCTFTDLTSTHVKDTEIAVKITILIQNYV